MSNSNPLYQPKKKKTSPWHTTRTRIVSALFINRSNCWHAHCYTVKQELTDGVLLSWLTLPASSSRRAFRFFGRWGYHHLHTQHLLFAFDTLWTFLGDLKKCVGGSGGGVNGKKDVRLRFYYRHLMFLLKLLWLKIWIIVSDNCGRKKKKERSCITFCMCRLYLYPHYSKRKEILPGEFSVKVKMVLPKLGTTNSLTNNQIFNVLKIKMLKKCTPTRIRTQD